MCVSVYVFLSMHIRNWLGVAGVIEFNLSAEDFNTNVMTLTHDNLKV